MSSKEKDNFQYALGSYCQQARKAKGYTRQQVAEVIDMSVDGLEKFEKGDSNVGIYYVTNLFAFLDLPKSVLTDLHTEYLQEAMQQRIARMGNRIN
ncbi:helix-turn-helix transcriptional regulator [Gracilibacillus caseinilyticus]|uniref:Helix-turn-helix transcriptional regulator n=1 Tax=Gracilibacillus caseinilyticus TaxID=2932256 RepID=A0ABY4F0Y6_9BACI|nr:helix-turn-helix transcriptional regulator [Gracilibacillus caseinilyticus]UOQ50334.1 helix-turn-helix transcriptional regulator [Gracilibacillus caseinilyticus]